MTESSWPGSSNRAAAAYGGCVLMTIALAMIWGCRMVVSRSVYVSALGADGEPTAGWFRGALLLVVAGGAAVAWAGRHVGARDRSGAGWTPSVSLGAAAGLFFLTSQVPCTSGCPVPLTDASTGQDLVHTTAAVLAFAATCTAMLQASRADGPRGLRVLSLGAAVSVAAIAGLGGLLAILGAATGVGSILEYVATSVAIGWCVGFGAVVARTEPPRPAPVRPAARVSMGGTPSLTSGLPGPGR